ncbi:MAG: N-acetyltransferase, partial [Bacteroidota bacterium]
MNLIIRQEASEDHEAVFHVIKTAFETAPFSDHSEHFLVQRLRQSKAFIPELSLVAECDGEMVGHIILTRIEIVEGENRYPSLALAPVSVVPNYQGKGIGGQLIEAAHKIARKLGHGSVVLL